NRQLFYMLAQLTIICLARRITMRASAEADKPTGCTLTQSMLAHEVAYHLALACRLHHFFEMTSLSASTSSSFSARIRLSLLFSSSSSFMRLASLTSIPAYLLRQL